MSSLSQNIYPEIESPPSYALGADINNFANLDPNHQEITGRIWAVGAIHGDAKGLRALHNRLANKLEAGDKIVYLGNYFGYGHDAKGVLSELLRFRIWFLSGAPWQSCDGIIYLRGMQEESLNRLTDLHEADNPASIVEWLETKGMPQLLENFDLSWMLLRMAAYIGGDILHEWTNAAHIALRAQSGMSPFFNNLKHAAYSLERKLAFVNSGFDPKTPLFEQHDSLWWSWEDFENHETSMENFRLIIRGYDPLNRGVARGVYRLNLDGGAGRGGELTATLVSQNGVALQWLTP